MSDTKYQSPWGKKNDSENDFTKLFNQNKKNLPNFDLFSKNFFQGKKLFSLILLIIFIVWLASGFFVIQEGQQAAIMRFGKFIGIATAGANYHLPYPIETITKVNVDQIQKEEIGFRSLGPKDRSNNLTDKSLSEESLMLTGDENVLDINFFVEWRVENLENYLFNVENIRSTVKSAAESAMREVIGNTPMALVQTDGRAKAELGTKDLLQKMLDEYKSGVLVENVRLLKVDPPAEVIDAFRDVQTARADKERTINQAEAYRNDILPKARGEAAKIIQESEGYKANVIAKASGDVKKFEQIYSEYIKSKDVTKKRMYLETMEKIFENNDKIIVSEDLNKSIVPYLPLNNKRKTND